MGRRLRYSRSRKPAHKRRQITELDLEILHLLARFRYLRKHFIAELLPHRSPQYLSRVLRMLYDAGYVERPFSQWRAFNARYSSIVYEITKKGREVIDPVKAVTYCKGKLFEHDMMVCDTLASLYIGLGDRFITYEEILDRLDEPTLKIPCTVDGKPDKIIPDGLFGLRQDDGKVAFFALEAERGNTIDSKNIRRGFTKKVYGYRDITKKKAYQVLGVPNLRVLVVAPREARVRHMMELLAKHTLASNLFLFHTIPTQEFDLKEPPPFPKLATSPWKRVGHEDITLV